MNLSITTSTFSVLLYFLLFSSGFAEMELLFNPNDNIVELDHASLEAQLKEPRKANLVLFYNGFCMNTQKFIPAFRSLSRKLHEWRRILKVYVFDCSLDENNQMCRNFGIRNTPALRYFPPKFVRKSDDLGTDFASRKASEIKSELALYLQKLSYFKMLKKEENVTDMFRDHHYVQYVVLIFQMCRADFFPRFEMAYSNEETLDNEQYCTEDNPTISIISRNTLLRLLPYNQVVVRAFDDHSIYTKFGVSPVPNLLVALNRAGNHLFLSPEMDSSKAYVAAVVQFLKFVDCKPQAPLQNTFPINIKAALRYKIFEQLEHNPTRIYRADLQRAIDHILNVELLKTPVFTENKLTVLRNFLKILNYISPLNSEAQEKLTNLYYSMKIKTKITAGDFKDLLLKSFGNYTSDGKHYVGCISNRSSLRGFPCSFWKLFHFLTVEGNHFNVPSVLQIFQGYVRYFMDCQECGKRLSQFEEMQSLKNVTNYDQQILWLWRAHNFINEKLAGDSTEDPQFPRIQFPSKNDCPSCRDNNSEWRTDEVLIYLKRIYSLKNLSWFGMASPEAYN
ncbi:sulfhydryl oxidase 2 [Drosophila ficusphila]|uniref:sulfhydryl oxidase 2 n=1 Tax=Drosophila ficusphila TaxID=30025 RepID=UPI0007E86FF4|nr:sulfhydryl oxidase 2 [Drosophila ficusphila]